MPAPNDLQKARMAICESCPELTTLKRCQQCGCFMTVKVMLKGAHCPLDKWPDTEQWIKKNLEEDFQK